MRLARKKVGDLSINLRGEEDVFLLRTTNEYGDPLDLVSEFQRLVVRHAAEDDAQSLSQQISELLHEDHADTLQQKAAAKKFSLSVLRRTREIQLKRSASMERSFDENALESVSLSAENSTVQADSEAPRPLHPVMLPAAPPREAAPAQRRPNRGPPSPPPFSSAATTHGRLSPFVEAASLSTPLEDTLSNTSRPRIEQDAALQAEAQTRRELTRVMAEVVQLCISACRRATAAETALRVMSHTMSSTHTSSSLQNSVLGVGHMAPSPTVRRRTLQPDEATAQSSDLPPPLAPLFGGLSASRRASTPHVISEAVSAELQSGSYCNSIAKTSQARMGEDELGTPQLNQYLLLSELGSGSQGKVMLGFDTKTNQMRAIKMIPRPQLNAASIVKRTDGTRQFARLQREIAIMKRCRHKNVVALYEVIDDEQASMMYLVMQYVEKGPIGKQHTDGTTTPITPSLLANYARQLCAGLHYLHDRGVIHRDIKPENILLDANDHVYLSDFGISSFDSDSASGSFMAIASPAQQSPLRHRNSVQQRGTFAFLAPELLQLDASSQSIKTMEASGQSSATTVDFSGGSAFSAELVDVWALGMTLYILLYGRPPWELSSMYTYVKCILDAPIEYPALVTPPGAEPYYIDFADDWRDLLQGMLCRDERNRLTALQAHSKARALHRRYEEEAPTPHIAPVHGQEIDVTEQDLCLALTATFRHQ